MADKHIADGECGFQAVNSSPDVCQVGEAVVPFDSFQLLSNKCSTAKRYGREDFRF